MNRFDRAFSILLILLGLAGSPGLALDDPPLAKQRAYCSMEPPPAGCTVFTVSKGGRVFFGGNDDYINPDGYYWVDPARGGQYGVIWTGPPDNVQQGVNEKGLAYDSNGLPRTDVNPHRERIPVAGGYSSYPILIMHECATVAEVIAWAGTHQWHSFMHDQMQFADASGDAVIISAGANREVVFTRKPPGDGWLVSSNFNVANPENGYTYPCPRYETAQRMLRELLGRKGGLTAADAARVLDAVHQSGGSSWTLESMVADLPNGLVYIYYFHQFDRPVVLNVAEELARPRAPGPLSALFPDAVRREAERRYRTIQGQAQWYQGIGMAWAGISLLGLVALLFQPDNNRRGLVFWISAVAVLGPAGLLIWLRAGRRPGKTPALAALIEATGDAVPLVISFLVMLTTVVLVPAVQASAFWQVVLVFGLPVLLEWLVFQGLLLTRVTGKGYWRTLSERLAPAWVAANLGLAGINAVAAPLAGRSLRSGATLPVSLPGAGAWWAMAVSGALAGGVLLFIFEYWSVRRGCRAWSVLAAGEGAAASLSWRQLGWWLGLSYLVLIAGVFLGVRLQ